MNNNIWGPKLWNKLHEISFQYPDNPSEEQKEKIFIFFSNLGNKLPCEACKMNYNKKLIKKPIATCIDNRESLIKWVIDIHNMVNIDLNKPTYNYDKAIELLKNKYMKKNKKNKKTYEIKKKIYISKKKKNNKYFLLFLLIFLFIFFLYFAKIYKY